MQVTDCTPSVNHNYSTKPTPRTHLDGSTNSLENKNVTSVSEIEKINLQNQGQEFTSMTGSKVHPVIYQGMQPGGQLTTTNEVENFPGYPEGIQGPEMMMEFRAQAERFGTDIRDGLITKVDFSGDIHKCWADDGREIHAETVIISTGATAKYLGLESEQRLKMAGVFLPVLCVTGSFTKAKKLLLLVLGIQHVKKPIIYQNYVQK